ncbi:MAG: hypothetical protein L3J71_03840 [Victivallaceae bacterium]|nr:hypothetical protein [Victivallaceae bacterium]
MKNIKIQNSKQVAKIKKNLSDLYEWRPLEYTPFEFTPYNNVKNKLETDNQRKVSATVEEYNKRFFDDELALQEQLKSYEKRVSLEFQGDTVFALEPMSGAMGWFNEFFGGKNEWFNNRPPYPHPIIDNISQIDSLKPDISKGEMFHKGLKQMRYFAEKVGDKIPVKSIDLQSPVNFASILIDYTNLIYMMMDNSAKIHQLMRMITDTLITSLYMIKKEMITDWPLSQFEWWIPKGVFMSDDLMAVLDPELYAEFGKPYNEIIAEEFGAVSLHSCGGIKHNLENVASTKGIVAINTHEPLSIAAPIVDNRAVLVVGGVENSVAPNYPGSLRDPLETGEEVAQFWWNDFSQIMNYKDTRFLYQCHALLEKERTPQEAYSKMLDFSRRLVNGNIS